MRRTKKEIIAENEQLKKQIKQLEEECTYRCRQMQVERLISKYNVPAFLLETSFAKEVIASGDLEKLENIKLHRHQLFYKKPCRLVGDEDGDSNET